MRNLLSTILFSLLITSCATSYVGQKIHPDAQTIWISGISNGHDKITYGPAYIEFDYVIDNLSNTIDIKGEFVNNDPRWKMAAGVPSKALILTINFIFLGTGDSIIEAERILIYFDDNSDADMNNVTFDKKIPYKDHYKRLYIHPTISGHYLM